LFLDFRDTNFDDDQTLNFKEFNWKYYYLSNFLRKAEQKETTDNCKTRIAAHH
jgi:hypothetical protein